MARFDRLGEALRTLREERRWNQVRLARRAGVSAARISRYERSVSTPSLATLGKILDALDVRLGSFDEQLGVVHEVEPWPAGLPLPTAPDAIDLKSFLGYRSLPPDLLPALSEMVACFQLIARRVTAHVIAERRCAD